MYFNSENTTLVKGEQAIKSESDTKTGSSMWKNHYWEEVRQALKNSYSIAFDGCHKIYLGADEKVQEETLNGYESVIIIEHSDTGIELALEQVQEWFSGSCPLRFVIAVKQLPDTDEMDFRTIVPQSTFPHPEDESLWENDEYDPIWSVNGDLFALWEIDDERFVLRERDKKAFALQKQDDETFLFWDEDDEPVKIWAIDDEFFALREGDEDAFWIEIYDESIPSQEEGGDSYVFLELCGKRYAVRIWDGKAFPLQEDDELVATWEEDGTFIVYSKGEDGFFSMWEEGRVVYMRLDDHSEHFVNDMLSGLTKMFESRGYALASQGTKLKDGENISYWTFSLCS